MWPKASRRWWMLHDYLGRKTGCCSSLWRWKTADPSLTSEVMHWRANGTSKSSPHGDTETLKCLENALVTAKWLNCHRASSFGTTMFESPAIMHSAQELQLNLCSGQGPPKVLPGADLSITSLRLAWIFRWIFSSLNQFCNLCKFMNNKMHNSGLNTQWKSIESSMLALIQLRRWCRHRVESEAFMPPINVPRIMVVLICK